MLYFQSRKYSLPKVSQCDRQGCPNTPIYAGIQNTKKIFDRFYKEQDRGIGIGLHIVKKLCEELSIKIKVQSQINFGTKFTLNLSQLTKH